MAFSIDPENQVHRACGKQPFLSRRRDKPVVGPEDLHILPKVARWPLLMKGVHFYTAMGPLDLFIVNTLTIDNTWFIVDCQSIAMLRMTSAMAAGGQAVGSSDLVALVEAGESQKAAYLKELEMPGKHELWLQNARVVVTITALALALIVYGFKHFFGS